MTSLTQETTQSAGLRIRHTQYHKEGNHLCQDSNESEATLKEALKEILMFADKSVKELGGRITYKTRISLYECQLAFHKAGGPAPDPEK